MGVHEILNRRVPAGLMRRANKHLLLDLIVGEDFTILQVPEDVS